MNKSSKFGRWFFRIVVLGADRGRANESNELLYDLVAVLQTK